MSRRANTHSGPPRRGSPRSRAFATWLLGRFGWKVVGKLPENPQAVLIGAPHTSNWDFPVCMIGMLATGLRISFIAKHTIFFFPANYVLKWLGAEPVDRSVKAGRIATSVERLNSTEQLYLGITPEGTRKRVDEWKTGFWFIAHGAGVPIVPIAIDWSRKELVITPTFHTSDDMESDIELLKKRFTVVMAKRAENFSVGAAE